MEQFKSLQKTSLFTVFLLMSVAVHSQNPFRLSAGARQVGLAYATIPLNGFWASFHNQASLPYIQKWSVGMNQDNRFGLSELSNKTFGMIIPAGNGALGMVYSYYGYVEYNRHTVGLAYGLMLGEKISAGVQTDLYSTRIAGDYRNRNDLTFEAGLMYKALDALTLAVHVYNPVPTSIHESDIPLVIRIGTAYKFTQSFIVIGELETSNMYGANFRFAVEYEFAGNFFLRGAAMSQPAGFAFGAGYSGKVFQANMGFITHESLGLTPSLSLVLFIR